MRLTSEQEDLRAAVRGLLDRHGAAGPAREPDAETEDRLWRRLCAEIGAAVTAGPDWTISGDVVDG